MMITLCIHKANKPLYEFDEQTLATVGFMRQTAPDSITSFWNGNVGITFSAERPVYVYKDWNMVLVSNSPLICSGPLLASYVPAESLGCIGEKVAA